MVCPGLEELTDTSLIGILQYPASCVHYFYAYIMIALWLILTLILFRRDQDKLGKGDFISSMAVSSIAIFFLATIGTGLEIITSDIFIEMLVAMSILVVIWMLRRD